MTLEIGRLRTDAIGGGENARKRLWITAGLLFIAHLTAVGWTGPCLAAPIAKGELTSSETCRGCHKDIYQMWRGSAHARSMEDTVFLDAFHETESREGEEVSKRCLACHAPTVAFNKDTHLKLKVTWEGVSCDVCHSLTAVNLTGPGPQLVLDVGTIKRGPIKDAASMAHGVAYSELHTSALVCAPCHEYRNPEGTPIISTYSEWKESAAAKDGRSCQTCHMGRTKAEVVDPRVKRVADAAVNLHEVPGGHSLDQLHKALGMTISHTWQGENLEVQVTLTNKGAGHSVPTGMPGRKVTLGVKVKTSDGQAFEESRIYSRVFNDAGGKPIARDSAYFGSGVRGVSDTRLKAGEKRVETFNIRVAPTATAYLTVTLNYDHAPTGDAENRTSITFQTEDRMLRVQRQGTE